MASQVPLQHTGIVYKISKDGNAHCYVPALDGEDPVISHEVVDPPFYLASACHLDSAVLYAYVHIWRGGYKRF